MLEGRVCCITALGFDHIRILGSTISEIALAKAGIFRDHSVFVASPQKVAGAEEVLLKEAALFPSSKFLNSSKVLKLDNTVEIGLKGDCQKENALTALVAVRSLLDKPLQADLGRVH